MLNGQGSAYGVLCLMAVCAVSPDQNPLSDAIEKTNPIERRLDDLAAALPNILTLCAIFCGLASIRFSGEERFGPAALAICAAAFLDVADGFAARRLSASSAIGAELDSLADFLNFGVAPAALLYWKLLLSLGAAGWLIATAYVLATGYRLARFNVQLKSEGKPSGKKLFRGLPSTGAAIAILFTERAASITLQPKEELLVMAAAALLASIAMLSNLRVPSLQAILSQHNPKTRDR